MSDYILEADKFRRSVQISRQDAFTLLLGAGASMTSGIPTATDCIWDWKRTIYESLHPDRPQRLEIKSDQVRAKVQQWLDQQGRYPAAGSNEEYSFYVEDCYPIEDDRRKFFQSICRGKTPSIGYKMICLLHRLGVIRSVWTTNFDDLCIDAAKAAGLLPIDISLDSIDRIYRAQNPSEFPQVKLHGDYKYGPLKNTTGELMAQDETFRKQFIGYLQDKHLIVSGYSGRDASIMEALFEAYSQKGAGRLYWCGRGSNVPDCVKKLIDIARANGRTAYYVPTDGFDKLFISLAGACVGDDDAAKQILRDHLSAEGVDKQTTPFDIGRPRVDSVIKGNFFKVGFPQEVFQFKYIFEEGVKRWGSLREKTKGEPVVAVPYREFVYALGTATDITRIFGDKMDGKITRVPVESFDLHKDSAFHHLLLATLTDSLARRAGLETDKRDLIWKTQATTTRRLNDVIYQTHAAIRLALTSDGNHFYLSLMPDFKVSSEQAGQEVSNDIVKEVGRTYFEAIYNDKFNDYINQWRDLLFANTGEVFEIEYPHGSGSGFVFKINRGNAFAGIQTPRQPRIHPNLNPKFIQHRGIQYAEPELIFASKVDGMRTPPRDFHPMRGLINNKPYDAVNNNSTLDNGTITLGVICPQADTVKLKSFLSSHQTEIRYTGRNKAYMLDFPGFQAAFATELRVPDPGTDNWLVAQEPAATPDLKAMAAEIRNQVIAGITKFSQAGNAKVIVIYIPDRWLPFTAYDLDNEDYDLHDFIKAFCAERGIATQFIKEDTLSDPLQCQINWWLSLSYYAKSLRTPWVLDSLDKETAFAGIGYSINRQGDESQIVLGCSHIYNSLGQGLKYRLSKVEDKLFWDKQKSPHLSYNDAYKFGVSIVEMFYRTMDEYPKRVVIHKRTYFTKDEIDGLTDSLFRHNISSIDLIEVNFEDDLRYVASKVLEDGKLKIDNFALPRGTCVLLNGKEALLWSHGVVPSVENNHLKFYLGGRYIPGPLRIRKHFGNGELSQIATEILGLTKMNWNSFDLYSQLPATVNSSNVIARIGKLLSKREGVTYDYRYFI
jgi:hypothetical protein